MNLNNFTYHMPTKVVYGENTLKDIDTYINHRKALLVTSQGFVTRGLVGKIHTYTDHIVGIVSDVKSHPEFVDIHRIYNQAHQNQFELIIAIGGGSVMDVAKFIAVHNEQGYKFVEDLTKGKTKSRDYTTIPIVSVPTTAGTGSELTPYSTIWDMSSKKKYSLNLPDLFCEVAIYDPMLTLSVPRQITIQTGLDALSHALESIWNKNANPVTISHATTSAKLIMDNLTKLADDLKNIEYRGNLMKACMHAGFAFSNTQTAVAHAISYYVTTHKNIDHGIACSFTLPMLIDNIIGQYDFVDDALREIFGELSSDKMRQFLKKLGVSTDFKDYGIDDKDLEMLKASLQDNQRAGNSLVSFEL